MITLRHITAAEVRHQQREREREREREIKREREGMKETLIEAAQKNKVKNI